MRHFGSVGLGSEAGDEVCDAGSAGCFVSEDGGLGCPVLAAFGSDQLGVCQCACLCHDAAHSELGLGVGLALWCGLDGVNIAVADGEAYAILAHLSACAWQVGDGCEDDFHWLCGYVGVLLVLLQKSRQGEGVSVVGCGDGLGWVRVGVFCWGDF